MSGLPQMVKDYVQAAGIISDSDLAGYFLNSDEVQEVAAEQGWPDAAGALLLVAWGEASHRFRRARARLQVCTKPSTTSATAMPTPTVGRIPSVQTVQALPTTMSAEELPTIVATNTLVEQDKVHMVEGTDFLRKLWLRMGQRGLHWQAGPPFLLELRWKFLMKACQRLTTASVRKHVKAWTSWEIWVTSRLHALGMSALFQPDSITVAQFMDEETSRGATLGRSRMQSFRWLRLRLGVPFPVEDVLLQDFVHFPMDHVSKPAYTMTPAMFVNILGQVNELGTGRAQEPMLVLFLALACVRHKHLTISTITGHNGEFVFGYCPQGKAKRRGTRPPFEWAVPRLSLIPNAFAFLLEAAQRMGFPSFAIPARAKSRRMPTRKWMPKPMGHMMTMRVIRQVFGQTGMHNHDTAKLTYNTCRRFLPTVANIFQYSRHDAQAIGSWVEEPSADGQPARASAGSGSLLPMSVHYSGKQALASGMVKQRAVQDLLRVLNQIPEVAVILQGQPGQVSEDAVSWDKIATIFQDLKLKHGEAKPNKDKKDKADKKDKKDKDGKKRKR